MEEPKVALVLSGGGSHGAFQMGAYLGMHAVGFRPDLVVGTSVGAINGAFIAADMEPALMRRFWLGMRRQHVLRFRSDVWRFRRWLSLAQAKPLRRFLVKNLNLEAVRASPIRLRVTAVDICHGDVRVFGNDEITVDHLLASSAIPGIFPPVEIDGHMYVDGGAVQATPVRPAVREGATEIHLILNDPIGAHGAPLPKNLPQVMLRVSDVQLHHALNRELVKGKEINELMDAGVRWKDWRAIHFHVLDPGTAIAGGLLAFDPDQITELLDRGEREGRTHYERLLRDHQVPPGPA